MNIGTRVKVIQNLGNPCEPFLGLSGIVVEPFRFGCRKVGWVGVILDQETIYGRKFNFRVIELQEILNP